MVNDESSDLKRIKDRVRKLALSVKDSPLIPDNFDSLTDKELVSMEETDKVRMSGINAFEKRINDAVKSTVVFKEGYLTTDGLMDDDGVFIKRLMDLTNMECQLRVNDFGELEFLQDGLWNEADIYNDRAVITRYFETVDEVALVKEASWDGDMWKDAKSVYTFGVLSKTFPGTFSREYELLVKIISTNPNFYLRIGLGSSLLNDRLQGNGVYPYIRIKEAIEAKLSPQILKDKTSFFYLGLKDTPDTEIIISDAFSTLLRIEEQLVGELSILKGKGAVKSELEKVREESKKKLSGVYTSLYSDGKDVSKVLAHAGLCCHNVDSRYIGSNNAALMQQDLITAESEFLKKTDMPISLADSGLGRIRRRVTKAWGYSSRSSIFQAWKKKILSGDVNYRPGWVSTIYEY